MIVKRPDGYYVVSEHKCKRDGKRKNLGGPYTSEAAAKKRLAEVEMFKHMKGKRK